MDEEPITDAQAQAYRDYYTAVPITISLPKPDPAMERGAMDDFIRFELIDHRAGDTVWLNARHIRAIACVDIHLSKDEKGAEVRVANGDETFTVYRGTKEDCLNSIEELFKWLRRDVEDVG